MPLLEDDKKTLFLGAESSPKAKTHYGVDPVVRIGNAALSRKKLRFIADFYYGVDSFPYPSIILTSDI